MAAACKNGEEAEPANPMHALAGRMLRLKVGQAGANPFNLVFLASDSRSLMPLYFGEAHTAIGHSNMSDPPALSGNATQSGTGRSLITWIAMARVAGAPKVR